MSPAVVMSMTTAAAHSAGLKPMATAIGPHIAMPTGVKATEANQS
jgi:hypothetical protein